MTSRFLAGAVEDVPSLRALCITVMPDCLLYDSWARHDVAFPVEDVASYFGDLVRSNRQALKALSAWSSEMQVTIEAADTLIVLREMSGDFVCGCIFERDVPLGMVRLHVKRLIERLVAQLPRVQAEERPRGVRVVEFLHRYAPDPHAVLMRLSLRAGVSLDALRAPERLDDAQVTKLEEAAKQILGLKQLNL